MGQGITILLAAAIPLLAAIALFLPRRHGKAAVVGPITLVALALLAVAVAYRFAPEWAGMAAWMGVSAALGGGAVAWWSIARLRGALGVRISVGAALGLGYAASLGIAMIPMLAFAVPVAAIIFLLTGARPRSGRAAAPPEGHAAFPPLLRPTSG